jgi:capsular polysaccharide export protein
LTGAGPRSNSEDSGRELPWFYQSLLDQHEFTDLALFCDTRAVHVPATTLARQRNVRVHVFEEGYLRPFWITVERGGVNAHSPLPRDPARYLEARKALPPSPEIVEERNKPTTRAVQDTAFQVSNAAAPSW